MNEVKLLYIDLFCGAGGTSTGVEQAMLNGEKCAKVIACVNHDANAIASHAANHPDALHFTEDIRTLKLTSMLKHLKCMRKKYPNALVVLWASLECTNFSKAKGGMPRDADSRTLAEHLFRYIDAITPDYIQIENVEEFMSWGELDENGKPISRRKGSCYVKWVNAVCRRGYNFDWRLLNSADYGAYTSRTRFFGIFAKKGLPIAFPVQTHAKYGDGKPVKISKYESSPLFHMYEQWKPVRDVLDLKDEGESIFTRKKPLCEKTLERIYAGLVKFVAGGKEAFIVKYNSMNGKGKYVAPGIDEPCPTVAVQNRLGLAKVHFLSKQFSGDAMSKNQSIERPAGTVTCKDHHAFITAYYGNGFNQSVNEPAPTITTKDRLGKINCKFLTEYYGGADHNHTIEVPATTLTTKSRHALVTSKFIVNYRFNNTGSSVEEPAPTICTVGQIGVATTRFLMNPQFASAGGSIDKPCFTLIARMDKMPPYLVSTDEGLAIEVYDTDSPTTVKIKEFMSLYNISDVRMRMLNVSELKRIQGFPDGYVLKGTIAEQKKFIGNAVEVHMATALCTALCEKLIKSA